ncbi:MAG: hypothetical protein GX270_01085 [Clostridiaceae bacterium]|nr:hypothetical protein [Clostridiaceae bacterium]
MPYTFNGIGSWYYGKKNEHTHQGTCEFCGNSAKLSSYDTTKFFVFLFIPIIPLGEKRVIDQCSCCKKHRVVGLKEWEKHLKETVDSQHANWLQNPNDYEAATELLHSVAYFRDIDKLNSISRDIRMHCSNNAEIMNELGLVHSFLYQFEEAESAFNSSLFINRDRNVEENLAEALMKNQKPDKAKPYLRHIIEERIVDKLYYILLLIESYQYIGNHRSAMQVIEECESAFPEYKNHKTLSKYRKISQRNYDTSRTVKGSLMSSALNSKDPVKFAFVLPKIIFPALLVLGFLIYTLSAFLLGLSREVYLVNGLDQPYSIEINGDKIDLQPMSRKKVKLAEGTTKVNILDLDAEEKNLDINIDTPFWTRPMNKRLLIINPDRVAVFLWQEAQYAVNEKDNADYVSPYCYYAGRHFYNLESVDYLFEELPETIKIEGGTKRIKSQLIQVDKNQLSTYYIDILGELDSKDILTYTKAKLNYDPDNETNLYIYLSYCDKDSAIDFLKARLDDRPVLVNWHRIYQNYMDFNEPSHDLVAEYSTYIENEKDNKSLYYLLSRILTDQKEVEKLLMKSIEGIDPCPYGYYGLAYKNLSDGNFEQASIYIQKAIEALPEQNSFDSLLKDTMLAQGMYDSLIKDVKTQQSKYPYDGDLVAEEIRLYMAKNDSYSAENSISNYMSTFEASENELKQLWNTYLKGIIAYYSNDVATYAASLQELEDPQSSFENALINGEFDKAAQIATDNGFDGSYFLLLYLAQDNPDSATKYLNQAIEIFRTGDRDERLIADYLSGTKSFVLDEVKSIVLHPEIKRIVMAALGKLHPNYKEELNILAKKLNYNKAFPYHLINEVVDGN